MMWVRSTRAHKFDKYEYMGIGHILKYYSINMLDVHIINNNLLRNLNYINAF